MNWLLFVVRMVLGLPTSEHSGPQRIAVRPDGTTTTVPPEMTPFQDRGTLGDWRLLLVSWCTGWKANPIVADLHQFICCRGADRSAATGPRGWHRRLMAADPAAWAAREPRADDPPTGPR